MVQKSKRQTESTIRKTKFTRNRYYFRMKTDNQYLSQRKSIFWEENKFECFLSSNLNIF